MDFLRRNLELTGQSHILSALPELDEEHQVFVQLSKLNIPQSLKIFEETKAAAETVTPAGTISPVRKVSVWKDSDVTTKARIASIGMEAIKTGKVAAVIMSGGQGTRLGFPGPKGMYNMGLVSHKTIFQLHVEKVRKIRDLSGAPTVPIYIMTSDLNDKIIRKYFEDMNYFGYPPEDIVFFEQGLQPCMSLDGKIIIESATSLALAPDGNGGLYNALKQSTAYDDLLKRNVEYLHIYGIDNVLTKSLDPNFIGTCIEDGADCGNKVVWRANKSEKVGVTAETNGKMCIIEYSELPPHMADLEDENGKLVFGAANICNHFVTMEFLRDKIFPNLGQSYHIALKKIPVFDPETRLTTTPTTINGVKLEMFIFDVFPLANKFTVMEVDRENEFAPVKNEPGNAVDSPDSARALMSARSIRWLTTAGAIVTASADSSTSQCEISPLLSYDGEGLERFFGHTIALPCYLE